MSDARKRLEAEIEARGLTVIGRFIRWSRTGESTLQLNWDVDVLHHGRRIYSTRYRAGVAHCPSYSCTSGITRMEACQKECETGMAPNGTPIPLDPADVIHALVTDAQARHAASFEDWADEYGYSSDSRKAEKMYNECCSIATALVEALGEEGLAALEDAARDL